METIISSSSVDRINVIKTILFTFVLVSALAIFFYYVDFNKVEDKMLYALPAVLFLIFSVMYIVIYGNLPTRLVLDSEKILLDAPFKKRKIYLNEISFVRLLERQDFKGLIRVCGTNGILGDWGYFSSATIRNMKVYTRRSNNWILISTYRRGDFVIAPDDFRFIHLLEERILLIRKK